MNSFFSVILKNVYTIILCVIENSLILEFIKSDFFRQFLYIGVIFSFLGFQFFKTFHQIIIDTVKLLIRTAVVVTCLLSLYDTIVFFSSNPLIKPFQDAYHTALASLADYVVEQLNEFERLAAEKRNVSDVTRA